ncbi:MAG: cyclic nucleotide-binding domain-containing protein [Desulfobacterales bacterium]|nr:cyclic nucleotide-binding domain-containing protein [Desulfobacterales bacterium]MCP4162473.1 cyclic nucleotide-binding domain-containing protein [Deltaproteobacteria bacterium]
MSKWSDLFETLPSDDLDLLISLGSEQSIESKKILIEEDSKMDSIFFILKGLFKVTNDFLGDDTLTLLGPGEIIGAVSFIDNLHTNVSIISLEKSSVVAIPHKALEKEIAKDESFGLRVYKALSRITTHRLRKTSSKMGEIWTINKKMNKTTGGWSEFSFEVDSFKKLFADADKRSLENKNIVTQKDEKEIRKKFKNMYRRFNSLIESESTMPGPIKEKIGKTIRQDFLPYMLLTSAGERFYSKPRGYAGDYYTIEMIYRNTPEGKGRVGPVLDSCFLELSAAKAVRNRRGLLVKEIKKAMRRQKGKVTNIMSIASGPGREIMDVYQGIRDKKKLKSTLLDLDLQALSFVEDKINDLGLKKQFELLNENILYLILGRKDLFIEKQNLIYSIGLIDYFNDNIVIKLLNYIYKNLAPNGRVILGNFHPKNPTKAFMDYVLEWPLIHRNEADMNRLFKTSDFNKECTSIFYEKEKINLFAECIKKKQKHSINKV